MVDLEDVRRLHLEPGDTLVLRTDEDMGHEQHEWLVEEMHKAFPDHRVLVLGPGYELEVVEAPAQG